MNLPKASWHMMKKLERHPIYRTMMAFSFGAALIGSKEIKFCYSVIHAILSNSGYVPWSEPARHLLIIGLLSSDAIGRPFHEIGYSNVASDEDPLLVLPARTRLVGASSRWFVREATSQTQSPCFYLARNPLHRRASDSVGFVKPRLCSVDISDS